MVWIGVVMGMLAGAAFGSFPAAVILAIIGGVVGANWPRKDGTEIPSLENRIKILEEQLGQMRQRMTTLEKNRPEGEASAAQAAPSNRTDPNISEAELERQALAAHPEDFSRRVSADMVRSVQAEHATKVAPADKSPALPASSADVARSSMPVPPAKPASTVQQSLQPSETATVAATVEVGSASVLPPSSATPPRPPAPPSWFQTFLQRWVYGGNPIVKVGVLILFLGLAFLLRYAAEHAVLPVEWRYVGVAATGIGLLLAGWRWRHKQDNYGLILQGAGIGVLYLTTLAAMKLHPLIPLGFGFAILIAVAAFAALLAILQNALVLAIIGTIGGFAAPILTSTGSGNHVALFSYLTLLNLGIVAIAWFRAWRVLNLIGYAGTFILGSAWAAKYYRDELFATTEPFLLLLFVLYVLITFLFARRTLSQSPDTGSASFNTQVQLAATRISYVDGTLAFGVPFSAFGLQYLLTKSWEYGAAFSALGFGLFYMVLAVVLFRQTNRRYILLTETLMALGVIFGSLAIPLGLEQTWTSAAWAVEAAGVYWVGIRQQRVHARLFALLLLIGSAIYFALGLHFGSQDAVLDGSLLGCGLLALSTWWTYRLMRQAPQQQLHSFEIELRPYIVAFGALFVGLIPFLLWPMDWASPALAILGTAAVFSAVRLAERPLLYWGWLYQALAGALFMTTLRSIDGGSVLSNGWTGLLAASLIGASMLAGFWAIMRQSRSGTAPDGNTAPVPLSGGASVALLAGLVFINLAPLFVLPWRMAAMVWPLTGIATLWWAVRARHAGAVGFALALQAVAGIVHFGSRLVLFGPAASLDAAKPFLHAGFAGPLLIALAALICARLLQRSHPGNEASSSMSSIESSLGWIALFWAGAWWAFAWADEIMRIVQPQQVAPCLVAVAIVTAWAASSLARRWNWPQLGLATLAYLPALTAIAGAGVMATVDHPLVSWGALAWPSALLMHGVLLRRQIAWVPGALLNVAHVAGAWLFIVLAAIELRWHLAQWGDPLSAWPLMGWMIAPVLYLLALSSSRMQTWWPIRDHQESYRVVSAVPIVVYLLGWVWISNAVSNGTASPLPYMPLLNPLELAHLAVLLGVALWWRSLSEYPQFHRNRALASATLAGTAFAVLTGMVVRTCHHFAQVRWNSQSLFASDLVQTSLSVVWSIVAIGLMLIGNRQKERWTWIVGAGLIAVVVVKLFLIELAASGSLARIISFIVVGMLLLLVGYFAPLPPKMPADPELKGPVAA
ncbi:MAG: hypothetical protein A3I66_08130 [Burkholderiales bacterium RIFCSPLOWO2_02_FULL_57_36]|nr:MAG: hypothetical protein A3I66_08130 [Burkholderiales bacterium RIFCSPLOWO2_02_FULL_57_36]